MPSPIVVAAVSGDETDEAVLVEAARLAGALGIPRLVILHVVETWRLPVPPDTPEGAAMLDALRSRAIDVLEKASRCVEGLGLEPLPAAREGRPCSEIVDFSEAARASAVVVGASGRGSGVSATALCVVSRFRGAVLVAKPETLISKR